MYISSRNHAKTDIGTPYSLWIHQMLCLCVCLAKGLSADCQWKTCCSNIVLQSFAKCVCQGFCGVMDWHYLEIGEGWCQERYPTKKKIQWNVWFLHGNLDTMRVSLTINITWTTICSASVLNYRSFLFILKKNKFFKINFEYHNLKFSHSLKNIARWIIKVKIIGIFFR